jgi:hypothetical protein
MKKTNDCVIETVTDCQGSRKVVKLFGERQICNADETKYFNTLGQLTSSVEDGRPNPSVHAYD